MEYSIDELNERSIEIVTQLNKLREDKGHDYSCGEDTLENLRPFGSFGVCVRIGDKFHRLRVFHLKGIFNVADEKVEDTENDLINYALYHKIMREQERKAE